MLRKQKKTTGKRDRIKNKYQNQNNEYTRKTASALIIDFAKIRSNSS